MPQHPVSTFSPWESEAAFQQLYDQLRSIAHARMAGHAGHTLTPTSLVNEAMLKMLGSEAEGNFHDEAHFVATACTAMRHILVDHARRKGAHKRTGTAAGGADHEDPCHALEREVWDRQLQMPSPEAAIDVSRELDRIYESDPEKARLIELRAFGGLTFAEIGTLLGIETKTAERRWRFVAAELRTRLSGSGA